MKVPAYKGDKLLGEYSVTLSTRRGRTFLTIDPCNGTAGRWSWYLGDLRASDILYLDLGQDWYVSGMSEVYRKIFHDLKMEETTK